MINKTGIIWRKIQRFFSRSEWLIRLFKLSKSTETVAETGLIMVQIDGLSRNQIEWALKEGRMPFVNQLIQKQNYNLHSHYSGLPASTPAVQGELFYGVKSIVPAFSYYDKELKRIICLYYPEDAQEIENRLKRKGEPLLKGGSIYSSIYSGGAEENHFCFSKMGFSHLLWHYNTYKFSILLLLNFYSLIRTGVLLIVETVLAFIDLFRGFITRKDFWEEIKFVPTRVGICILLRELITIGVKMDVSRGLPIIHLNLVGYDEQAHRRGPSSLFAHWTLRGIDDAIKRIYQAARRSPYRDYTLWIFSDHGQENSTPFIFEHHQTIDQAIKKIFDEANTNHRKREKRGRGIQLQRIRVLNWKRLHEMLPHFIIEPTSDKETLPIVTAMGPLGFIYTRQEMKPEEKERVATALVNKARIPMVMTTNKPGEIKVWTEKGVYNLPSQANKILGPNHPFLEEVSHDLIQLCHHPDTGDFIFCGWTPSGKSLTFPNENGSHGGFGLEETNGFAILPCDTPILTKDKNYLRPMDLRKAAQYLLGRAEWSFETNKIKTPSEEKILRIMTYNVHSCIGMDGKVSPQRIARVIARQNPDIAALQELDVGRIRTQSNDQAKMIANFLQMGLHFHPAMQIEEELYGDAILSRFPMQLAQANGLPRLSKHAHLEPRGALWVTIETGGNTIQIINTHLGLNGKERLSQTKALLGEDWIGHPDCEEPIILCGDFNSVPGSKVYRLLKTHFRDSQMELKGHRPQKTWFGTCPLVRIDYVFISSQFEVVQVQVPDDDLCCTASDHLPLIVDLKLKT